MTEPELPGRSVAIGHRTGFDGSAVGIWPISEQFDVFAKLGFIYWDADGSGKSATTKARS